MRFIGGVIEKLQRHPKRIVFPEGNEPRVLQAARQFYSLRLGVPLLLGDRTRIKEAAERLNVPLEGVRIINPEESEDLDNFARRFEQVRRYKGIKEREAREAMLKPNYFGAMMVAMQLLGTRPHVALLSYSTKGSATHPSIGKVQAATALAEKKAHEAMLEAD